MSDKLVVEFVGNVDIAPVAVLASSGGDNPASAALTIADFLAQLARLNEPRYDDAGLLAARFVVWQSGRSEGAGKLNFLDVSLTPHAEDYGYQLARIYARTDRPYVHIVRDRYSTNEEMAAAAILLRQPDVDEPITPSH